MARFIGFGDNLLIEVDFLSGVRFDPDRLQIPGDENNPTVYFSWKDGTESDYKCTPEQWKKLRSFLKAQGMVVEI